MSDQADSGGTGETPLGGAPASNGTTNGVAGGQSAQVETLAEGDFYTDSPQPPAMDPHAEVGGPDNQPVPGAKAPREDRLIRGAADQKAADTEDGEAGSSIDPILRDSALAYGWTDKEIDALVERKGVEGAEEQLRFYADQADRDEAVHGGYRQPVPEPQGQPQAQPGQLPPALEQRVAAFEKTLAESIDEGAAKAIGGEFRAMAGMLVEVAQMAHQGRESAGAAAEARFVDGVLARVSNAGDLYGEPGKRTKLQQDRYEAVIAEAKRSPLRGKIPDHELVLRAHVRLARKPDPRAEATREVQGRVVHRATAGKSIPPRRPGSGAGGQPADPYSAAVRAATEGARQLRSR